MAQKVNNTRRSGSPYRTNGAAAYDIHRLPGNGTAAPKLPERQPRRRPRQRPKAKIAVAPLSIVALLAAACMLVFVISGYVQVYEESSRVEQLSQELSEAQDYNERLQSEYDNKIDIDSMKEKAERLGMTIPTSKQTVYLNLAGVDRAVISDSTGGFFETAWAAIVRSFNTVKEYFVK